MPISSEIKSGFGVSKWEKKYLRCRYIAHRNKVACACASIDSNPPPPRPHVHNKSKKALMEQRRQMSIFQENLRVLNRTAEIMNSDLNHVCNSEPRRHLTAVTRRNTRIVFQWFIHKFGQYVPWWAHISY